MKIVHYSPLPPAKTGIADYSAALIEHLARFAEVETIASSSHALRADEVRLQHWDNRVAVYQLGNNPHHDFVYKAAVAHPGVIVLHEANLHHLVVHLTLAQGKTDLYWHEVALNGGKPGNFPDYANPMLRTVLTRSRAAIVHSVEVESVLREQGFERPVQRIQHGAWNFDSATQLRLRSEYRAKLGFGATEQVFGIFGFLKPYKRIAQAQRAFRRITREIPGARLLLVGERHPEVMLDRSPHLRHIDFAPIADFNGYMAACDVVVNLRYPTAGETSGTMTRAMAMGKPVIVSDTGSFREYPEHTCLRVPPDLGEEELLFEYMNLLARRPEVRDAIGSRAQKWTEENCSWATVAEQYARFLADVSGEHIRRWVSVGSARPESGHLPEADASSETRRYSETCEYSETRQYTETHWARLEKILAITPPGGPDDSVLEMGVYFQITAALKSRLGYGEVRGCYLGPKGRTDRRSVTSDDGEAFACAIDHFDAERERFPYGDGAFATVLCCELLEHLQSDPMQMMVEIQRILKAGGHLVLTTPNIASLRSIAAVLEGFHPMLFPAYLRPKKEHDARHAREYTTRELHALLENAGFEVTALETGPFRDRPQPNFAWAREILERYGLSRHHTGDCIYVVGRKVGPVASRYPAWLYA